MSDVRILRNAATKDILLARTVLCASAWCHFWGLQFRAVLPEDEGILFMRRRESIVDTSIHMFFMRFSIAVIWIDGAGRVVDKKLAKPWRPAYASSKPAQYYLEANVGLLDRVQVGDVLTFDESSA
jgi:hypothetical protein